MSEFTEVDLATQLVLKLASNGGEAKELGRATVRDMLQVDPTDECRIAMCCVLRDGIAIFAFPDEGEGPQMLHITKA